MLSRHDCTFITYDREFTHKVLQPHLFTPIAELFEIKPLIQMIHKVNFMSNVNHKKGNKTSSQIRIYEFTQAKSSMLGGILRDTELDEVGSLIIGKHRSQLYLEIALDPARSLTILTFGLYALLDRKLVYLVAIRNQLNDFEPTYSNRTFLPPSTVWFEQKQKTNQDQ